MRRGRSSGGATIGRTASTTVGITRGADSGSASLLMFAVSVPILAAFGGVMAVGDVIITRHQAQAAADLGALAGAARAAGGTEVACARAADLVVANGGRLTTCDVSGLDVVIRVDVVTRGGLGTASARARAGPER